MNPPSPTQRITEFRRHRAVKYLISLGIIAAATVLQLLSWPIVRPAPYLFYYPAVILAALYGDGVSAIVMSVVAVAFFFSPQRYSLFMEWPNDWARMGVFVAAGTMIRRITHRLTLALLRAQAEREGAERARAVLEAERDLRERFVAVLSHDLRTPLAAIGMTTEALKRHPEITPAVAARYDRILSGVRRADKMIQNLLDANRIKAGEQVSLQTEKCELTAINRDLIDELSAVHGQSFVLESPGEIWGVWDADALRRVGENLLNNAAKYGPPGTPITIRLSQSSSSTTWSIHNQGDPISEADQAVLFQPFHRARAALTSGKKGWGLGLTLVKGLVEAHRGEVRVESAAGRGTRFVVTLPSEVAHQLANPASPSATDTINTSQDK